MIFELPLAEVVFDFYDQLKSITRGYASFDYELLGLPRNAISSSSTSSSTANAWTRSPSSCTATTP